MAAPKVFGAKPAGLTPFAETDPEDRDDFRISDHIGRTVIINVVGPTEIETNDYGTKTAIECSVVLLDEDGKGGGTVFDDVLIFNSAPVAQLKKLAGQRIVALVDQYETKQSKSRKNKKDGPQMAPRLDTPSPEMVKAAELYEANEEE